MIDHYFTISKTGEAFYKEKGSKFLAFAYSVASIEEVNEQLESLRKEYHDARHHCYAYILGNEGLQIRANDDGEPNHSAGDPILGQIKSFNLTNTLIVVVRYFGGTKLGVSGLITAYKTAAEEALKNTTVVKKFITTTIKITYSYGSTNQVMKLIDQFNLTDMHQEFAEHCQLEAKVIVSKYQLLLEELNLLIDTGSEINILSKK